MAKYIGAWSFGIEPTETRHLLTNGFAFSRGLATVVVGRLTLAIEWPVVAA